MIGVLVLAHGTPARPEDIGEFFTRIRRGRAPSPEEIAELAAKYELIGGLSPFAERTEAQVSGIRDALGDGYIVALGQKFADPFIPEAVEELIGAGVERIVGIVLAPHYSPASIGDYAERATAAIAERVPFTVIKSWHDEPVLIDLLAERVREVWIDDATLIVTAHSLPQSVAGDRYVNGLTETAALLHRATGVDRCVTAWQSAPKAPIPWLEPSLLDTMRALAADGATAVVVCAAGFTSEHLEIRYDLDTEAAGLAAELGMGFARTRSLDGDPRFCALLAELVRQQ